MSDASPIDPDTILAKTIGTPTGGMADNPWPAGHPAEGEQVAILAFDVTSVDGESERIRTYHVGPIAAASSGAITAPYAESQGITVQWTGCGTGTIVRPAAITLGHDALATDPDRADALIQCEVRPDDPQLIQT
jgi:hypothetical protein